ncbi:MULTISPECIES: ATP-binding protein [Streptomyces]|uniref:ATP-binding protein n=1 Tax=Streptomyces TaxID=1883 RepID=UPI00163B95F9|nr:MULTISPECIES: ATP-binding protein [Streptomyces]MBC2875410.1 ATP-binding protein [Streptomyces sp. TYQ1024]UBI35653.1 ATP-binding protein [Streptomyces mobaraensis]UKW28246.1 ATP-binding protein [Streptomyces sp. TYQ1024]
MSASSRDTLSPAPPADAVLGTPDAVVPPPATPWRGPWDRGLPGGPSATAADPRPRAAVPYRPAHAISLPASPRSVATARAFSRRLLAEWGLDALTDDTALLLSELVTNAIVHVPEGTGDVELSLSRTPAHLVARVTDRGGALPRCSLAAKDSENGRGMWLVEQIADRWGHDASPAGKTVWFALPLPDGPRATGGPSGGPADA